MEALKFLSGQPDGIVLTQLFDKDVADAAVDNPPRPLYLYESTAYVSAFSDKSVYLEDEVNLEITDFNWQDRREKVEDFLQTSDINEMRDFLKENSIRYIYWTKEGRDEMVESQSVTKKIFENDIVDIHRVIR